MRIPMVSIRLLHEKATVAQINPQIIGDHNMMNILAAAATLSLVDIDESQMLESIERFPGVKRRLEFLGEFFPVFKFMMILHITQLQ